MDQWILICLLCNKNKYAREQSTWWSDILKVGGEDNGGWFNANVCTVLGKGNSIQFWKTRWLGPVWFAHLYPQLFNKALCHDAMISDVGLWNLQWEVELLPIEMEA
jgi:hypothetical protein